MNKITFILIAGSYIGFLIGLIMFTIIWYKKNNILLSIDEQKNGLLNNTTKRGRIINLQFYSILQFITTKSLFFRNPKKSLYTFLPDNIKNNLMTIDAIPILQPRKLLNVIFLEDGTYQLWKIPTKYDKKNVVNNLKIVKLRKLRKELWESTDNTSNADLLYKLLLPMGMVLLAICCLIFFPKIYEAIMSNTVNALSAASDSWIDSLRNIKKPMG